MQIFNKLGLSDTSKTVNEFADSILTTKKPYVSVGERIDDWLAVNVGHVDEDIFKYLR